MLVMRMVVVLKLVTGFVVRMFYFTQESTFSFTTNCGFPFNRNDEDEINDKLYLIIAFSNTKL